MMFRSTNHVFQKTNLSNLQMDIASEKLDIDFVISTGNNFYEAGWKRNFLSVDLEKRKMDKLILTTLHKNIRYLYKPFDC